MGRQYKYYATYTGTHKHMRLVGMKEELKPGIEFEVPDKKIWYGLVEDPNFKTRKGYSYKK